MKMTSDTVKKDCNTASDEEQDLPDLFENDDGRNDKLQKINIGDIVYAEFRNLLWPALVRNIYKKDRKISIWYLDAPGKTFKVSMKKIRNFGDSKINKKIMEEISDSPLRVEYKNVLMRTISYMRRKSLGSKDDPHKFFDNEYPYLALLKSSTEKTNLGESESEEESVDFSNEGSSSNKNELLSNSSSLLREIFKTSDENKDKAIAIVNTIQSGGTNKHLLQVKARKIHSNWQKMYDDIGCIEFNKIKQRDISYGPVKSMESLMEIHSYLQNFYEEAMGNKNEHFAYSVDYITCVWMPESIVKAISLLENVSLTAAREIFFTECKGTIFNPVMHVNDDAKFRHQPCSKHSRKSEDCSKDALNVIEQTNQSMCKNLAKSKRSGLRAKQTANKKYQSIVKETNSPKTSDEKCPLYNKNACKSVKTRTRQKKQGFTTAKVGLVNKIPKPLKIQKHSACKSIISRGKSKWENEISKPQLNVHEQQVGYQCKQVSVFLTDFRKLADSANRNVHKGVTQSRINVDEKKMSVPSECEKKQVLRSSASVMETYKGNKRSLNVRKSRMKKKC